MPYRNEFNFHSGDSSSKIVSLANRINKLLQKDSSDPAEITALIAKQSSKVRAEFFEHYQLRKNGHTIDSAVLAAASDDQIMALSEKLVTNKFEKSPFLHSSKNPATMRLVLEIHAMTADYRCPEKELAALILSKPDDVRMDFYANYELSKNHFMPERCFLAIGTEDEIVALTKSNAAIFNSDDFDDHHKINDLMHAAIRRGLTRVIDTMIDVTVSEQNREFLPVSLGIFMSPDHQGQPHVNNEAGQNYLRSLDHMIAKGFDINGVSGQTQPQLTICALYPSLLPELEKRGADLEKAIEGERYSASVNPQYTQRLSALEDYKAAKALGKLADTGNNWADVRANGDIFQDIWRQINTALSTDNPEDEVIAIINRNPIGMTTGEWLMKDMIGHGMPKALNILIEKCEYQNKRALASGCLETIGRNFSPADKIDTANDIRTMACLDVLVKYGANHDRSGLDTSASAEMIVLVAQNKRTDLIPALVTRGADLAGAKNYAANAQSCDNEQGVGWYDTYPVAKALLANYQLPSASSAPTHPSP